MLKKAIFLAGMSASLLLAAGDKVVGYFPYWLQYAQFTPSDVRYEFFTDINYGYLVPDSQGDLLFADQSDQQNFEDLIKQARRHHVGVTASIGGYDTEETFKELASSAQALDAFAKNVQRFVQDNGLNGVELDWLVTDADDYSAHAKLLNALLDAGVAVSATVPGTFSSFAADYGVSALNKLQSVSVVFMDQMSWDESSVVPNADFKKAQDVLLDFVRAGVDASKLIAVVPTSGKTAYSATGLGSSHQGQGSGNEGIVTYKDLMKVFEGTAYRVNFDEASISEVAVSENETIVFNGIPSYKALAEFVKKHGLGGIAMYDVAGDHTHPLVSLAVTIGQILRPEVNYQPKKKRL